MTIVLLLIFLQIKHFLADFPLQSPYHYKNKGTYGHPGGIEHALIHGSGTWGLLAIFGFPLLGMIVCFVEAIIHYHIDWAKVQLSKNKEWSAHKGTHLEVYTDKYFYALGFDQLLHQLTYLGIALLLV